MLQPADSGPHPSSDPVPVSTLSAGSHRAAVALAEAIIPSAYGLPGADEGTVAAAEHFVSSLGQGSPWIVKAWGAALQAVDLAAVAYTGKRFAQLGAVEQASLLQRWQNHPVLRAPVYFAGFLFKLGHFDRADLAERLGHTRTQVAAESPRYLREQVHDAGTWTGDEPIECDVVVIGTGAGGAVVAKELAERGHAVVLVEEGFYHQRDSFNGSSVDAFTKLYRNQVFTLGNNVMPVFAGRLVGGSTAVNTGTSLRTPERVLQHWCEQLSTDDFAPGRMNPHFEAVERELQVGLPERRHIGPFADVMERGCKTLGWSWRVVPRNAAGCEGQGFCQFGCATDARRSTNLSYVPRALASGALLFVGFKAERILEENGRAVGIEGVAVNGGRRLQVRAQMVVLAGGSLPTPLLLLRQGICNGSGQVGHNLSLHPSGGMNGVFPDRIDGEHHIPQGVVCDEFLDEGLLLGGALAPRNFMPMMFALSGEPFMKALTHMDHIGSVGVLVEDEHASGRVWWDVAGQPIVTYNLTPSDVERLHKGMIRSGELFFAAGASHLYPAIHGWGIIDSPARLDALRRAKLTAGDILLTSYHPLGTCKMGRDRRTSVVDIDHQTHELPGLYIVDGSTVPTAPGVNPQITIMAMARRAAGLLHERLH